MRASVLLVALAACGGGGGGGNPADAPKQPDAAQATTVVTVDCATTTAAATVMTTDLNLTSYMPMATTITMGQVVKFVMSPAHNVAPNSLNHPDPGLTVGFGATKCLRFTQTGTFGFLCTTHSFVGTVTVN